MTKDLSIHIKIWFEKKGESVIGPGRMAILEAIDQTGSLTQATEMCNISFRKAWKLINEINDKMEQPVISTARGGKGGGGGTTLTEYGKKLLKQYRKIQSVLEGVVSNPDIWSEI